MPLLKRLPITSKETRELSAEISPARNYPSWHITPWFASLGKRIDIRLLLIGSLLPDIIDKPLGHLLFRETFSNGRIFCHTLLFLILVTLAGVYLHRNRRKTWLLVLSFGTFTHLIFDQMWLTPRTLLWPLYGVAFDRTELANWLQYVLHTLSTDPAIYVPEIIGAVILILFIWVLVSNRKLHSFIIKGEL